MAGEETISVRWGNKTFYDAQVGINAFVEEIKNLWEGEAKEVAGSLRDYLTYVATILAARNGGSWPSGTTGKSISSRTGQAAASIIKSVKVTGTTWERLSGSIGGVSYLAIHEFGGTITAAAGKFLTIPLPAALSSNGVAPPYARQWKNTFVARSKAGNLIIFQRRGTEIVPLYVLKPSVTIPARLGMRQELNDQIPYFLGQAADSVVRDFMRQLGGKNA